MTEYPQNPDPSQRLDRSSAPLDRREPPESPCTRICEVGPDQVCRGCHRTLSEIALWGSSTAAQQWKIVDRAALRAGLAHLDRAPLGERG